VSPAGAATAHFIYWREDTRLCSYDKQKSVCLTFKHIFTIMSTNRNSWVKDWKRAKIFNSSSFVFTCFLSREPSVDTVTSYFGFLSSSSYYTILCTHEKETLQIHYSIKTRKKLSLNSIIIDVTGNTLRQKRHDIVLSCYEEFRDFAQVIINFLSGSNIWAAFKIPRQRLLLINALPPVRLLIHTPLHAMHTESTGERENICIIDRL